MKDCNFVYTEVEIRN